MVPGIDLTLRKCLVNEQSSCFQLRPPPIHLPHFYTLPLLPTPRNYSKHKLIVILQGLPTECRMMCGISSPTCLRVNGIYHLSLAPFLHPRPYSRSRGTAQSSLASHTFLYFVTFASVLLSAWNALPTSQHSPLTFASPHSSPASSSLPV